MPLAIKIELSCRDAGTIVGQEGQKFGRGHVH